MPKRVPGPPGADDSPALDPRTLGRPVHLLPRFTLRLGEALGDLFRQYNRRYRAHYELGTITLTPGAAEALRAGRWWLADLAHGRIACRISRSLVLSLMTRRLGGALAQPPAPEQTPPTATEERLQAMLGQQLLERVLALIADTPLPPLQACETPRVDAASWTLRVAVHDAGHALDSELLVTLPPQHIDLLLAQLGREGQRRGAARALPDAAQLPHRLSVTLHARLLEQTVPLGELLALSPGDVLPVQLRATEVRVDGARLFTASVAEHQGKLCLTSFADAD